MGSLDSSGLLCFLNDAYSVLRVNRSLSNVSAARMQSGVGSVITVHGIIKASCLNDSYAAAEPGWLHGQKMEGE